MGTGQFVLRVEVRQADQSEGQLSLDLARRDVSYVHFRSKESERAFREKLYKLMQDSSDALLIAADET